MQSTEPQAARALSPGLIVLATALLAACATHSKQPPAPVPPPAVARPPAPPVPASPPEAVQSRPLPGSQQDFVVNVGDRVYFDFDQYMIRADAQPVLTAEASWLNRYPDVRVRIEGNCDERGTREYNLALGARRAESVRSFLVERGVLPSRITTISFGKERPIDPGEGEEAWGRNRNAHTAIVSGAQMQ